MQSVQHEQTLDELIRAERLEECGGAVTARIVDDRQDLFEPIPVKTDERPDEFFGLLMRALDRGRRGDLGQERCDLVRCRLRCGL